MAITAIHAVPGSFDSQVSIPVMLTDDEKSLYFQLGRNYSGAGSVIEIGPWLGGSTFQVCRGLEMSGKPWELTVFDRFKWTNSFAKSHPEIPLRASETSLPVFEEHLFHYASQINCIAGELAEIERLLPLTGGIELVFIDAPTTWRLLRTVMGHIAPHLLPNATVVFQDLLHIPSRQVAWLAAALPWLEPSATVEQGTAVAFTVTGTPEGLDEIPRDISQVPTRSLLEFWERLAPFLPEGRAAELASALALELLEREQYELATAVADRAIKDTPNAPVLVDELTRLLRKSPGGNRKQLLQLLAYLRAGAQPDTIGRATDRVEAMVSAAAGTSPATSGTEDREAALAIARNMGDTGSPTGLALRHVMHHGITTDLAFRRLFNAMQSCVELDLPNLIADFAPLLPGASIVEINGGPAFNGLLFRAMGAERYVAVLEESERARRAFRNPYSQARVKTNLSPQDLETIDPALSFVGLAQDIPPGSADLVLIRCDATSGALDRAMDTALGLLRPGGRMRLTWRNPRSWSGHGRAPQTFAEYRAQDPDHAKHADWAHIKDVRPAIPNLAQLRTRIGGRFELEAWTEEMDDPEVVIRLTPRVKRAHPRTEAADLTVHTVHVIARV